jgi:hypothetical protein
MCLRSRPPRNHPYPADWAFRRNTGGRFFTEGSSRVGRESRSIVTTIVYRDRSTETPEARTDEQHLWLTPTDLHAATTWERKPEGLCRGDVCVPIPSAAHTVLIGDDGRIDLAAFARYVGDPVVCDPSTDTWVIGESATSRRDALRSLDAPDFTLPDLDGTPHSLSDYRGKKVLLLSWASW